MREIVFITFGVILCGKNLSACITSSHVMRGTYIRMYVSSLG